MERKIELEAMLDEHQIRALLVRYAVGLDRRDAAILRSCFTDDARFEVSREARLDQDDAVLENLVVGPGAEDLLDFFAATAARFRIGTHFLGASTIETDGSAATAETYSLSFALPHESGRTLIRGVRYLDWLVRTDAGWRVDHRLMTLDWATSAPMEFGNDFADRVGMPS